MPPPHPDYDGDHPILPDGMHVPAQVIDEDLLSGDHDWIILPATGLSFRETVEQVAYTRADMARYRNIASSNRTIARNLFSLLCRSTTLFRIPETITCSRTFARDNEEAYYVDAMDKFLSGPEQENLEVRNIPLLQRPLRNRMFCSFARKPGYRSELFHRRRLRIWLPHDAPEDRDCDDSGLCAAHPKTEEYVDEIYIPPALAVPLPPAYFFFFKELKDAQILPFLATSERIRRLKFCARKEYPILTMAMWWNEVYFGGRMYVLNHSTINVFERECGEVHIAGMSAQGIIAHMRVVAGISSQHHNWMCFDDGCMETSTFVWGVKYTGGLDASRPARRKYYCSKLARKISTRKYGAPIVLGRSVMEERLSIPDLDRVIGLLSLIDEHNWQAHGSLRVIDLLHHMYGLHQRTDRHLLDLGRDFDSACRDLDAAKSELRDARDDLRDADNRVKDREDRIDYLQRILRSSDDEVSELRKRLEYQSRELSHARSQIETLRSATIRSKSPTIPQSPMYNAFMSGQHSRPFLSSNQFRPPNYRAKHKGAGLANWNNSQEKGAPSQPRTPDQGALPTPHRVRRGYPFHEMPRNSKSPRVDKEDRNATGEGQASNHAEER